MSEQETRLSMLNNLLTTPHRKLNECQPLHTQMINEDPLFYRQLSAWYNDNGEIRDHKDLFVANLCLSDFEGHRDIGLALLRDMPPFRVARVVDFIHNYDGLGKNIPRSMRTEIERYLREREASDEWFDSSVMSAKKYLKRLYSLLHIKPSDRAQSILFDEVYPENSKMAIIKELASTENPTEQAKIIKKHKISYKVASTIVKQMTPAVILSLIGVMSDQELINNIGSLQKHGVFDNPEMKEVVNSRLEKAKKSKKVSALKSMELLKHVDVDEDTKSMLESVADNQLKNKGRIKRPTALLIDKSSSMNEAIILGKHIGSMISSIMDADFYCYAFDEMPYPINVVGNQLADWEKALSGIKAQGWTGCGSGLVALARNKQYVEQVIIITDEGENKTPMFTNALQSYAKQLNISVPDVTILRCGRERSTRITDSLRKANLTVNDYDFNGDYYSLPGLIQYLVRPSKLELLMDIMAYPVPSRKVPVYA